MFDETGPSSSEIAPQSRIETIPFGSREILRLKPDEPRIDPSTGKPVMPLLFIQGINGDDKLPWALQAFAKDQQREVIAIKYPGKFKGSAKIIETEGIDSQKNTITQLDVNQATDIALALTKLHIDQVDAVGESRGAIRLVAAMKKYPRLFRSAYLAHPAGQDDRSYNLTHLDATRNVFSHAARKALGKIEPEPPDDIPKPRGGNVFRNLAGWRKKRQEHKSVAHGNLHNALSEIADENPEKQIMMAGDRNDKAFLPRRLQEKKHPNIKFFLSNWGGHGIGTNRQAVADIGTFFKQAETEIATQKQNPNNTLQA